MCFVINIIAACGAAAGATVIIKLVEFALQANDACSIASAKWYVSARADLALH
jgi:hypothetical protein